ncbi:MAG: penicillin acylase family protein [Alphaproteobacteria bacterium]|nr:penicillin acylase family protein [Alphaproteobacteria bacterium]
MAPGPEPATRGRGRRLGRPGRLAAIALAILALLVVAAAAGALWWADRSAPVLSGRLALPGFASDVVVARDARGVVHVHAGSEDDAHAAQGFVHAQDRFAQMDMMRLLARGRLAEVAGRGALASDRFMRGLGLARGAERAAAELQPGTRAALEAYARGVNAFLDAGGSALPVELRLAGRVPEPWSVVDSLLWGQLMALHLSGDWREELARARLAGRHPAERLALLWPGWTGAAHGALPGGTAAWDRKALARLEQAPTGGPPSGLASNAWVLSGALAASGKPILANDPHLQLGAPAVWHLVRLEAPGFLRAGASAPGVPGIVLGHNGMVGWGMTTTGADSFDLFVEKLAAEDGRAYATPGGGSTPFAIEEQEFRVRGEAAALRVVVRASRNGPVLADIVEGGVEAAPAGHVIVLASPLLRAANTTADALMAMNAASDVAGLLDAARGWVAPVQNLFAADVAGDVAGAVIGLVPERRAGDGWLPAPAWAGDHDWLGLVQAAATHAQRNPAEGMLANANDRVATAGRAPLLAREWDAPYRGIRLREELGRGASRDVQDARRLQRDTLSTFARDMLAATASWSPADPAFASPLAMLRRWDARMDRDRPEPLLFNAWMRALRGAALAALLGEDAGPRIASGREAPPLLLAVARGDAAACAGTDCPAMLEAALREAIEGVAARHGGDPAAWRWGAAHAARFENPFWSAIPVLRHLFALSVPTAGDNHTLDRGTARHGPGAGFDHVHGAGLRMVLDFADLDASLFMIAPGQSGHALSRHRADLARAWADGEALTIPRLSPGAARATALSIVPRR